MASLQTGRTPEDRIEEEVRRRLVRRMSMAGLNMGAIANEVAYWLPSDFMRLYMEITEGALDVDTTLRSSMAAGVGDEGKATKAKVGGGPKRGKMAGGLFTRGSGAHARGGKGGGGYGPVLVRDENLLILKQRIDRRVRKIMAEEIKVWSAERNARKGGKAPEDVEEAGKAMRAVIARSGEPQGVNPRDAAGRGGETHGENSMESFLQEREVEDLGTIRRCVTCKRIVGKAWICGYTHGKD